MANHQLRQFLRTNEIVDEVYLEHQANDEFLSRTDMMIHMSFLTTKTFFNT